MLRQPSGKVAAIVRGLSRPEGWGSADSCWKATLCQPSVTVALLSVLVSWCPGVLCCIERGLCGAASQGNPSATPTFGLLSPRGQALRQPSACLAPRSQARSGATHPFGLLGTFGLLSSPLAHFQQRNSR